jgi:hypothetical protein
MQSFLTTPFVGQVSYLPDLAAAKKAALRRPIRDFAAALWFACAVLDLSASK